MTGFDPVERGAVPRCSATSSLFSMILSLKTKPWSFESPIAERALFYKRHTIKREVVKMGELNERQQRFVDEYIKSLNATQSAIKAGYSERTAGAIGSRLLKDVKISTAIKNRMDNIENKNIADAQEVLEYFTRVMRRQEKEKIVVTLKEERSDWVLGDDGKYRKNTVKQEKVEIVEIEAKLSDANTAAIQLAKRYGLVNGDNDKADAGTLADILEAVKAIE